MINRRNMLKASTLAAVGALMGLKAAPVVAKTVRRRSGVFCSDVAAALKATLDDVVRETAFARGKDHPLLRAQKLR